MKTCRREDARKHIEAVIKIENEGVAVDPLIFKDLDYENTFLEQIRARFDWNFKNYVESKIPASFHFSSSNFFSPLYWNDKSELSIRKRGDKFYLVQGSGDAVDVIDEIVFDKKPKFYNMKTSDGKDMSRIAQAASSRVDITYSNECSLKDKGLDCKFCNINATKDRFGQLDKIEWKTPTQIAEAITAAYKYDNFHGFNLTGGFIPERREVEYYIDVIEAVQDVSGLTPEEIRGMACVGAPQDLSVIDKYKEAGYTNIATNMEVWDEDVFRYICPGKIQFGGDHNHWVRALKHEVEVFGKGNVRSLFVGGLETKERVIEGIEELSSYGVIAQPCIWKPCIGSALEGHRSPETQWHQDLLDKTFSILKKNGFTYEQYYYGLGCTNVIGNYFKLDGQWMPWEEKVEFV